MNLAFRIELSARYNLATKVHGSMKRSSKFLAIAAALLICSSCSKTECIESRCPTNEGCCGIGLVDSKAGDYDEAGKAIYEEYFCATKTQCASSDRKVNWQAIPLSVGDCGAVSVDKGWEVGKSVCPDNSRKGNSFEIGLGIFGD